MFCQVISLTLHYKILLTLMCKSAKPQIFVSKLWFLVMVFRQIVLDLQPDFQGHGGFACIFYQNAHRVAVIF